ETESKAAKSKYMSSDNVGEGLMTVEFMRDIRYGCFVALNFPMALAKVKFSMILHS
ncbi:unnamed protein product, partial [Arabidopsis halleri]